MAVSGARGRDMDMVVKSNRRDPCGNGIVQCLDKAIQKPVCDKIVWNETHTQMNTSKTGDI